MKGQTAIDDLADAENQAIRGGATLVRARRFSAECPLQEYGSIRLSNHEKEVRSRRV